jgi:hypothetical protein
MAGKGHDKKYPVLTCRERGVANKASFSMAEKGVVKK